MQSSREEPSFPIARWAPVSQSIYRFDDIVPLGARVHIKRRKVLYIL